MSAFNEIAYAKINLALHVRHRRADGYHALETIFAFADDGDRLEVAVAHQDQLTITGPFAARLDNGPDNLVLKALLLARNLGSAAPPLAVTLHKCLPIAAGIGGGSADAAAMLRLIQRNWPFAGDINGVAQAAIELGADVPACVLSQTVFGSGIGEKLSPCSNLGLSSLPVLLVNPCVACPTGPVFQAWDGVDRGELDPEHWMAARNDLEFPAIALIPLITDVLQALGKQSGVRLARMSGSGATCFGLFDSPVQRDAAYAIMASEHPDWWTMAALLR
jgi:4-diphosphocytidyl-2-C-methyl-D-erythritol kinase